MDDRAAAEDTEPTGDGPARWQNTVAEVTEARLRQLVAERLGIEAAHVAADASLVDDLGADEMDLLEIAVALEEEFGLVMPDAVLCQVRTYGDLSAALAHLLENLPDSEAAGLPASGIVRVRVIRDGPEDAGAMLRAARLTPRVIETIIEEVLWTAGVCRLELTCSGSTTDGQLAGIVQRLSWLRNRGIQVSVQRLGQNTAQPAGSVRHTTEDNVAQVIAAPMAEDTAPLCAGRIGSAK